MPQQQRRIFALADAHLGLAIGKTMDRFGDHWVNHAEKIRERTAATVGAEDVLLLPGDLSWALKRREAESDLAFLEALPGIKVAIKGNHDYWWESDKPIAYPGLLSPPLILDDGALGIAGTRLWEPPQEDSTTFATDKKIWERELRRLDKSLEAIQDCAVKVAMTHYPPQPVLERLLAAGVTTCTYGHIHLNSRPEDEAMAVDGVEIDGVTLYCVAADRVDFTPKRIL